MVSSGFVINILWSCTIALQAAIVLAMVKRNLLRDLPFFFSYIAVVFSRDLVLLCVKYPSNLYARVYWYAEPVTIFLALAVIFESVKHLFPKYSFLRVALKLARTAGAVAVFTAVLMMVMTEIGPSRDRVFDLILLAERSVKFMQASWLILVIVLMAHCGGSWRQYSVGIVLGFGIHAALTLAIFELRAHLQLISISTFVVCDLVAYNLAAIVWFVFFLRPLPSSSECLPNANVSEWNDAAVAYTQQWYLR